MTDSPFPKNPYVIGVPLTGDFGFYGRRAVFTFVEDTLNTEQQNVIVLYGQRRVGKTSLLHQLVKQLKGEVLPIYFDLQSRAQQSLGQVLYELARTIARPLKMSVSEQAKFDNAGRFFREEFLPSVYQLLGKRRLLLLFDEFDVLGDELTSPEAASETLFPYLQSLIMHERQIVFIFVVGRRIEELATHFQAIFKQAAYRRVGLLKPEDARTLIVEPVKEVLTFAERAIEAILNLTAGHPYFTQLICSELFNAMKANNQHLVTKADVLKLVSQAIESGHGALNWFWDGLPRAERFIMSAVAHVTDETGLASKEAIRQILEKHRIILTGLELTDAPDKLVEWEMLRREGPDNYRFVVELVRRWIIKMHPLESARRDVDFISQRAVRSYENAREAHSAGDLEYARDEYRRALAANPNHSGAQLGVAQVLFELGQIEAAIEEFTKAYALDEISARDGLVQARLAQGKKLEEISQPDEAILQYEQALKIAPTHETIRQCLAAIWLGRGHAALATGDLTATAEPYQKALDFDSDETMTQEIKLKFEAYAKQAKEGQNYEKASQVIHQLRKLLPKDKAVLNMEIAILARRGDELAKEGKEAEAIETYQKALALSPDNANLTKKMKAFQAKRERRLEIDRLFNQAMIAHQAEDWVTAEKDWVLLIKMDVLNYKGRNIAILLAEASNSSSRPQREQLAIDPKPPQMTAQQPIPSVNNIAAPLRSSNDFSPHSQQTIPSVNHIAAPMEQIWIPTLLTSFGWAIPWVIAWIIDSSSSSVIPNVPIICAFGGLITALALRYTISSIQWYYILMVVFGWAIAGIFFISINDFGSVIVVAFVFTTTGAIGGFITGLTLEIILPSTKWPRILFVAIGWAIGWGIGGGLSMVIDYSNVINPSNDLLAFAIGGAIMGVIGGGIMFWQLSRMRRNA